MPLAASLTLALLSAVPAQTVAPSESFAGTFGVIATSIRSRYYARETRKDEMEGLLRAYEPKAKAATNRSEFESVVDQMIAEFKDSHFDFLSDTDQGYYLMDGLTRQKSAKPMPQIGAWFKRGLDGYTVTMVLEGFEAERAGLRKGDVVLRADGAPFSPIASLAGKVGSTIKLSVKRSERTLTPEVQVRQSSALELFLDASRNSARVIEHKGKKLGYFHLWTQANDDFRNVLSSAVYGRLKDTDAMILDLRDGFGGRPEGFADPFFRPEVNLEWKLGPSSSMKQLFGYQRPLVVLINEGSRSAKEVLSYILKKSKRATLVGSTTAGHVLGTSPIRVNDWAYLEIPMVDLITDNERLEGKGVSPDVVVPTPFGPDGEDLVLAKALEIAAKKRS